MMFRSERNASPFSLLDMDMWDTNLTAQSSAWSGMASVSGSEFMSNVNTRSSPGPGSFRRSDPGLRKWQSLSHLAPNVSPQSFSPSPPPSLRSGRVHSPFRQTGVMHWLQEAQERMDSHMDLLGTDPRMSSANLLNVKPRERHFSDIELFKLKQALIEAESRAKRQEEECEQSQQKLQTATEAQKTLLIQTTELKQRLTETIQNQSELQDQLREANKKISQACLEKATLSTQVLKLEDTVHDLETKLSAALRDKDVLAQERVKLQEKAVFLELQLEKGVQQKDETDAEDTAFLKDEVSTLKQANEDLTNELDAIKQTLKESQVRVQELTKEKGTKAQQIIDLEAKCAELINKMKKGEQEDTEELREQIAQLRASSSSLKFEKQRQQDRCLFLETEVFEKEQQLKLLEDKYRRTDAGRVQHIEKLQAVVSHWTEKWQKAALDLQCTGEELDTLRKKNSSESEALLRLELDACKQELELLKSRSQTLLNKEKDGGDCVKAQDKETLADSCLLPSELHLDIQSIQDKQLVKQSAGYDDRDEGCIHAPNTGSLNVELGESKGTATQPEQGKILAVGAVQQQSLLQQDKDERPSAEDRRGLDTDTEQQQRLDNEQIKGQFKEKEEKDVLMSEDESTQDWVQTSRSTRGALHDRWSWHRGAGLMPVFEEEEPGDEDQDAEKMLTQREMLVDFEAQFFEPQDPDLLRTKWTIQGLDAFAEHVSQSCTDVSELNRTWPHFIPDGIFHVEMVDICSPDEEAVD